MKIISRTLFLIGLGIIGFALLANHFGFDKDNSWGAGRILVLIPGIILLLLGMLTISWKFWVKVHNQIDGSIKKFIKVINGLPVIRISSNWLSNRYKEMQNHPAAKWYDAKISSPVKHSRIVEYFEGSNSRKAAFASAIIGCIVIMIYIWLISVGQWTKWPSTEDYYYELSSAFWHGQLNLLIEPDPALLALPDPYDYESRANISHPWDVSFFNGKFYLYWGPTPAIVLALVRFFYVGRIGDQILVFTFLSGAFLFAVLLILQIYNRVFSDLGWGIVVPGVLMAGIANPLPWILNRPGIYEAAISGGQLFLISGFYFAFLAIGKEKSRLLFLVITSICWVFAIGSRVSLIGAVGFLIAMVIGLLFYLSKRYRERLYSILAISIPFTIGLIGMGLYNKFRFGSWLELGHRYQLTGQNLNAIYNQVISFSNIPPNLHNYLLNPFRTITVFPYIKANWGGDYIFFYMKTPPNYYAEQITGLLPSVPYVILAVLPVIFIIWKGWQFANRNGSKQPPVLFLNTEGLVTWLAMSLSGATLLAFSTILFYLVTTMRYLADMVILATLTSTLGFFMGLHILANQPRWKKLFVILVILITVVSITVSLLLAITGYEARFEKLNPLLFEYLTNLLTP
jgi:hypothetical protein